MQKTRELWPSLHPSLHPKAVFSDMAQSATSSTPHIWSGSITFIVNITDKNIKPDASAKLLLQFQCQLDSMFLTYSFDDDPNYFAALLRKVAYCVKLSVGDSSNASLTFASSFNSNAGSFEIN